MMLDGLRGIFRSDAEVARAIGVNAALGIEIGG